MPKKTQSSPPKKSKTTRSRGFAEDAAPFVGSKKRAANVSIDGHILDLAKEMGINLSETLEARLLEMTREERERRWKIENRAFLESYDRYIEENGIFGEDMRTW